MLILNGINILGMALDLIEKINSVLLMDMVEIVKIFGSDMSSSSYANNKKKYSCPW